MMRSLVICLGLVLSGACASSKVSGDATSGRHAVRAIEGVSLQPMATLPKQSPPSTRETHITINNVGPTHVQWDWLGFDGGFVTYATLAPKESVEQPTYAEHIWIITSDGERLGWFAAPESTLDVTVH